MVFRGVLAESPGAFSGEQGTIWGNRSPEVAHTQDREARTNIRLAPSSVQASCAGPLPATEAKISIYSILCFIHLEEAQDKASQSQSLRKLQPITLKNMPSRNRFIQPTCLVGGFAGPDAEVCIICLALPLIIH